MTIKELKEWLSQFPEDAKIFKSYPVQGDCENCTMAEKGRDFFFDDRYPAVVLMP